MILAKIFFFLVVSISVTMLGYMLFTRVLRPILFKEDMTTKLDDASEDFIESEVDEAAKKIRKKGTL